MAGFFKKLIQRFTGAPIDWDDLEESLIGGDLGIRTTMKIVDELKERNAREKVKAEEIVDVTKRHLKELFPAAKPFPAPFADRPRIILVVGVNGTGKTTSSAKLAYHLKRQGKSVMLVAADTFRAAAIEQLESWSVRLDIPLIKGQYKADPSSVCYDACDAAQKRGIQYLICDTAGRLHTRHNLMEELKKIQRILGKKDATAPHDVFLVVDATTGGNALIQAKEFDKIIKVTGLILTKLDGSGKGGIAVTIGRELKIWPQFVGTGEAPEDFAPFEPKKFVEELL